MTVQDVAQIVLRDMTAEDIHAAAELSFEQQWPHREQDWARFLSLGEGIVAEMQGKVVGTIMGWRFGDSFATLGMVIVTNSVQGRGVGRQLMDAMLKRLEGRTVILNATAEGLPLYRKMGFVELGTVCQHQGPAPVVPLAELRPGERVRPMGGADAEALEDLYAAATGMDRKALLDALLPDSSVVVLCREHEQTGFAFLRRFGRGWAIAPVVAPDLTGAKALVSHWLGTQTGSFCRIDIPEDSGMGAWLEELGLPEVGRVTRMALGPAPIPSEAASVFGLAGQALG
ncbi:GCN5-related N-acetyltransferase [Novosphingobium aromaticivorans DSM 12444]|uniref:GCN5-related N-acetyltransferase n=1 Tax=Novosphingobium aromaticivorans (strain ATCC 700278 / DSM 12444 / CCUG 56034 / CIP 105152 / NBRC 16084 / F199) TaxID=279238 RepID=Q2G451_NOVAD|nr:GNAT family N-acetyltransferase [Novosphingobium aromaticivorans]ABD27372.1 GCN5-related N-acetyltransferase [Novosphingobium aromaticivorans DSM 12444]SCY68055.1 Predicted N-acetyltransferase YhbS [Novosphingobium aromaticivorans]